MYLSIYLEGTCGRRSVLKTVWLPFLIAVINRFICSLIKMLTFAWILVTSRTCLLTCRLFSFFSEIVQHLLSTEFAIYWCFFDSFVSCLKSLMGTQPLLWLCFFLLDFCELGLKAKRKEGKEKRKENKSSILYRFPHKILCLFTDIKYLRFSSCITFL